MLTTSPEAMPSPSAGLASSETRASPVVIPTRSSSASSSAKSRIARAARTARSGSSSCATWCAEERHHRVADELLDRAAVALELGAHALVVGAEYRLDVLGIERLGLRREPDEVAEDDRDDLPLSPRCTPRHG